MGKEGVSMRLLEAKKRKKEVEKSTMGGQNRQKSCNQSPKKLVTKIFWLQSSQSEQTTKKGEKRLKIVLVTFWLHFGYTLKALCTSTFKLFLYICNQNLIIKNKNGKNNIFKKYKYKNRGKYIKNMRYLKSIGKWDFGYKPMCAVDRC